MALRDEVEREAFEKWMLEAYVADVIRRGAEGRYINHATQAAWAAWLARAALTARDVAGEPSVRTAAETLLRCNSRTPVQPEYRESWVAVSVEHFQVLRAALALPTAPVEPFPEWAARHGYDVLDSSKTTTDVVLALRLAHAIAHGVDPAPREDATTTAPVPAVAVDDVVRAATRLLTTRAPDVLGQARVGPTHLNDLRDALARYDAWRAKEPK